ncbi:MAG: hypothetical protein HDR01_08810 [Lachnospiraceae bacterium]|nr:hypothetical protein [Lachnospiraceae bacterium]
MQSNEDYLDSLLKAAMGDEEEQQKPEEEAFDSNKALSPEEIEAMFAGEEELPEAVTEGMGNTEELTDDFMAESEQVEESLEDLLAELGASEELSVDEELEDEEFENTEMPSLDFQAAEAEDTGEAGELWDSLNGEDDEMAEINELLSQSGSGDMMDEDMLALLENMSDSGESELMGSQNAGETDEIDIFALDAMEEEEKEEPEPVQEDKGIEASLEEEPEKKKEKKEKKEKKGWFGKGKKKKEQNQEAEETKEEELPGLELTEEGLVDVSAINGKAESEEIGAIREKEPKKPGFFSNLMDFLMEEEEEEEEPKPEKNKKEKKGKKKAKQGKGPASEENEAILDELEEEDKKNKKKKKPQKVKKQPKEKKQEEPSKEDGKKLPKKMVIRIFVMCFSVMILIIIPAMLLPGVFSLRDARKAYYNEDYKTAYENLLGKNLSNSDSLILEKATILMRLQRKYDSFVNYHKMGKETEALNALLEGCSLYIQLQAEAQEQNISNELDAIHQDILNNLEYMYGVTEDQAGVLISIEDDAVYTEEIKRLAGSNEEITGGSIPAYRSDAEEQPEE